MFVTSQPRQDGERGRSRERENVNAEPGKEHVFTDENEIKDVNLRQDGCVAREDGLVMIDSGAPVHVSHVVWELQAVFCYLFGDDSLTYGTVVRVNPNGMRVNDFLN